MKTLHINIHVKDIQESIGFYSALFGAEPVKTKPDYAKWALADPKANFSISLADNEHGVNHLGIEVESEEELKQVYAAMDKTEQFVDEEGHTVCCYANSEKSWVRDPQGLLWEAFNTYGDSETNKAEDKTCCEPTCCTS